MKSLKQVAITLLFVLVGILFPLVIWIMLAISLRMLFQEWMLRRAPSRTLHDVLMAAGLRIEWDVAAQPMPMATFPPLTEVQKLLARAGL